MAGTREAPRGARDPSKRWSGPWPTFYLEANLAAPELQSLIASHVREPLFLVEVELAGDGRGRVLRAVVDTDAGVTVEQLAALNRELGRALDEAEAVAGAYRLEVCSPGLDRPLRHPRLLARALGRPVRALVADPAAAPVLPAETRGRLLGADDEGIVIEADGGALRLPWQRLRAVHHLLEW